jgi:excisionase family DNA binding protein
MEHQNPLIIFNEKEQFFTVREAADLLKVSRSGMYQLLKAGIVRAIRLGRLRRIPASEICRISQLDK